VNGVNGVNGVWRSKLFCSIVLRLIDFLCFANKNGCWARVRRNVDLSLGTITSRRVDVTERSRPSPSWLKFNNDAMTQGWVTSVCRCTVMRPPLSSTERTRASLWCGRQRTVSGRQGRTADCECLGVQTALRASCCGSNFVRFGFALNRSAAFVSSAPFQPDP